jgi:hypothetical protein
MSVDLEPVFARSCTEILTVLAGSLTCPLVNDLTIMRNNQTSWGCAKRIVAEIGYLVLTGVGVVETVARVVASVVVSPVLGIAYFIGRFCCFEKLKEMSEIGMTLCVFSVLYTAAATADALLCSVKDNLCQAEIPLSLIDKVHARFNAAFPELSK